MNFHQQCPLEGVEVSGSAIIILLNAAYWKRKSSECAYWLHSLRPLIEQT